MRNRWLCVVVLLLPAAAQAQIQVVGPGSTVEGDVRRGEGVFLQGLGWYELNNAKAFDQYSKTIRENDAYIQQQNAAARRAYNAQIDTYAQKLKLNESAKKRYLAERESRLRSDPTQDDIERGDALNALLVDLSDPTIPSPAWRNSKIELPENISIKALAFQFTPRPGAKASAALSQGLIAIGRLDTAGRWPDVFPLDKLKPEMAAYEAAYAAIREQAKVKRLELSAVLAMDRSLEALKSKVKVVVPTDRGFQAEAVKYVDELMAATKMFNASTLGYAREMIADTSQHEAHTVEELLAFMRKYRLVFAKADAAPGGSEMYSRLYGLLKQQADALEIKPGKNLGEARDKQWVTLFNNKDLVGWFVDMDDPNTWNVENGILVARGRDYRSRNYLLSNQEYEDFRLKLEIKFEEQSAGGITFRAIQGERLPLRNGNLIPDHPLVKMKQIRTNDRGDTEETGTMHWIANQLYVGPMKSAKILPAGQWNQVEIEVQGRSLKTWVNGEKVVDTFLPSGLKLSNGENPALGRTRGRIGLQKHTGTLYFRNIYIHDLNAN